MDDGERANLIEAAARLTVSRADGECVLGRPDLGIYVAVPEPGAVFVEVLQAERSLAAATAAASAVAGEDVDGADFLDGLASAGLLDEPGDPAGSVDKAAESDRVERRVRRIRWVEVVDQATARRLFGPVAWTLYGMAALFAVTVLVLRADLRPSFEDIWFLPDPVVSVLAVTATSLVLGAVHEAWHWLAGRAAGVPAAFRVSYRGYFLVFETDLSQIVTVPRRRRYGPYLAGMAFDSAVLAVALALRMLYLAGLLPAPAWVARFLAALVLVQVVALGLQLAGVFLRTDAYAVLANALRCHNLYRATWLTTKARMWGLTDAQRSELAEISPHDRRVASWFGLVYLLGLFGLLWMVVYFALPFAISMGSWVVTNLATLGVTTVAFWESAAVAFLLVLRLAAPPLLALRERRLRKSGGLL